MPSKVFIHATNIHQGGGLSLLDALMAGLNDKTEFVFSLDDRKPGSMGSAPNVEIKRVIPSIARRFVAEIWLAHSVRPGDVVLCLGNLPPLFKLRGRTLVFIQNRYLIDCRQLKGFTLQVRLRIAIERLWLSRRISNVSEFIVQTPTMKKLLELKTRGRVPVHVLPFVTEPKSYARGAQLQNTHKKISFDFVYVASGEPHKNHRRLIQAWCLLAEEGYFPVLCLTLDEIGFAELLNKIEVMRQRYGLKVMNVGVLPHKDVLALYKKAGATIYPSTFESFGLPLIEARQAGLAVLASELDYVRDVIDPEQSFDPESAISIARAVKRFMGIEESMLTLLDAKSFMAYIADRAE